MRPGFDFHRHLDTVTGGIWESIRPAKRLQKVPSSHLTVIHVPGTLECTDSKTLNSVLFVWKPFSALTAEYNELLCYCFFCVRYILYFVIVRLPISVLTDVIKGMQLLYLVTLNLKVGLLYISYQQQYSRWLLVVQGLTSHSTHFRSFRKFGDSSSPWNEGLQSRTWFFNPGIRDCRIPNPGIPSGLA